MNSIQARNLVAEKFLLLIFALFLILAPYEHKYIGKTCFLLGLAIWLVINILKYKQRFYRGLIPDNPLNKPILIFGIACLFSIVTSLNPYHSQSVFFERYLMYGVIFWIAAGLTTGSKKNLYILTSALIVSSFIFSLGGVRDYYYYRYVAKTPGIYDERLWTVFDKIIPYYGLPLYLTFFIPFIIIFFIYSKNKWLKAPLLITLALLLLCLIRNASRTAWISVVLSVLFIIPLKRGRKILPVLTIIVVLAMLFMSFNFSSVIKRRLKNTFYTEEWSYRLPLHKSAVLIFRDYPIFGAGLGMYEKVLHTPKYELSSDYIVPKHLNLHAHNTYLEVAAEMGIIGFLAFIWIVIVFFKKALKTVIQAKRETREDGQAIFLGLLSTIIAVLIFAFFSTIITVGTNNSAYFWFLLGVAAGLVSER